MKLNSPAVEWAKIIIKMGKETVRRDTSDLIKKAGYDIAENVKWLQQYYLEKVDELTVNKEKNKSVS